MTAAVNGCMYTLDETKTSRPQDRQFKRTCTSNRSISLPENWVISISPPLHLFTLIHRVPKN